jgi:hypothetical protein
MQRGLLACCHTAAARRTRGNALPRRPSLPTNFVETSGGALYNSHRRGRAACGAVDKCSERMRADAELGLWRSMFMALARGALSARALAGRSGNGAHERTRKLRLYSTLARTNMRTQHIWIARSPEHATYTRERYDLPLIATSSVVGAGLALPEQANVCAREYSIYTTFRRKEIWANTGTAWNCTL